VRRSGKGLRYAVFGFALICVLVLGGMTWATIATWRLAELNVQKQNEARKTQALIRIDNQFGAILAAESARAETDYVAVHRPNPILSNDYEELEPSEYLQLSPITLSKPPHDWIELYFQVDQYGQWSSPQLPPPKVRAVLGHPDSDGVPPAQLWSTLRRLEEALPAAELDSRLSNALERRRKLTGEMPEQESVLATHITEAPPGSALSSQRERSKELQKRSQTQFGFIERYVHRQKCDNYDISEGNIRNLAATGWYNPDLSSPPASIETRFSDLVPFWLKPSSAQERGLAFVRHVTVGDAVIHQGFLADWDRLKPELLEKIDDLFPHADLEPVDEAAGPTFVASEHYLSSIPARLTVPEDAVGASAAAWREARGVLLTTWAAAVALLLAAGWGVRNLVGLTERRLQFAYAVTHELRTPLTTFRLYTDMLSAGLVPDSSKQEYLDTLNQESARLSSLVEDVLEYARLENHKVRLNPVATTAASLMTTVTESLERLCRANGLSPRTHSDVPPDAPLQVDIDLVNQIAGVLLNNACRHARGSKEPTVLLYLGGENGTLHLDVIDTGPGIDRFDARTIFKPFRRGRNADATAQGGIGLGLALARDWADLLGGRLDLAARRHPQYGGAHFRLTIPY